MRSRPPLLHLDPRRRQTLEQSTLPPSTQPANTPLCIAHCTRSFLFVVSAQLVHVITARICSVHSRARLRSLFVRFATSLSSTRPRAVGPPELIPVMAPTPPRLKILSGEFEITILRPGRHDEPQPMHTCRRVPLFYAHQKPSALFLCHIRDALLPATSNHSAFSAYHATK